LDDIPTVESSLHRTINQVHQRRELKGKKGKSKSGGTKGKGNSHSKGKGYDSKGGGSDSAYYYACYDCRSATGMPLYFLRPTCAPNPFDYAPQYVPTTPWPTMKPFYSPQAAPSSGTTVPPWYPVYFPPPATIAGQTLMPAALTPPLPNMLPFPSIMTKIPFSYSTTTSPPNPLSFPVAPTNGNNPVPPWYPIYFSPYTTELPENPSSLMPIVTLYPTTAMPQYILPPPITSEQPSSQTGSLPTSATTSSPYVFPTRITMPPEMLPVPYNTPEPIPPSFIPVPILSSPSLAPQEQPVPQTSTGEPIAQSFPRSPISTTVTTTTTWTPQEQKPLLSLMPMSALPLPSLTPQGGAADGQILKPHSKPAHVQSTYIPTTVTKTSQPAQTVNNTQPSTPKKPSLLDSGLNLPAASGNATKSNPTKPAIGNKNVSTIPRGRDKGLYENISSLLGSTLTSSTVVKEAPSDTFIGPSEILPPQDYPRPSRQWDVVLT